MANLELDGVQLQGKLTQLVPRERNDGNILVVGFTIPLDSFQHDSERISALNAMFGEHCDLVAKRAQLPLPDGDDASG